MKKVFLIIYKLMFILIPIPLFFDFGTLNFLYVNIDDFDLLRDSPKIPLPIGALAFLFAILIGYVGSIFYSNLFRSVFSPTKMLLFYFLVVLPLALYAIFISSISLPRLVQILLPMIFISLLSFPVSMKDRIDIFKNTMLSGFLFFNLHFLSVSITSVDFLDIDSTYDFSNIFGILIYQSLVTYPAVLSLYLFLTIAFVFVITKDILPELKKYKYFAYYFLIVLLYLLAASGRRAFLIEFLSSLIVVLAFSLIYAFSNRYVKKKTVWYFSLYLILFIAFFIFYVNTPLSRRVLSSIEQNTFDSGRVDILGHAYDFFTTNLSVLFFGGGQRDAPGFHNFVLDQIYRVGIIGLFSVYIIMGVLIRRFVKINDLGSDYKYHRRMFLFILLAALFMQSMINASVSQPYYFVNFLMATISVYFILFTRSNSQLNS